MKIKSVELKAFGPFSGQVLDFSSTIPGLHIVYGPNEAGKSSAMRALQALLFGFPVRTSDNFLHQNPQLLVGGCLQGNQGQELTFFRRKRNVKDLFDLHDNSIDPSALTPYLHGLEKNLFTALYGIDHETLVSGGQGILDQQGDVGKALFAAGAGLASLKPVMDELETEGDSLFRPQGSSKSINEALARHKELLSQCKQNILSGRDWEDHQHALEDALQKLSSIQTTRQKLETEKRRLERLLQALPDLADRKNLLGQLEQLRSVRTLPVDFSERRIQIEQKEREARRHFDQVQVMRYALREKMKGLSLNHGLLDEADAIEKLHQRLGEYLKGKNDRPLREGQRLAFRSDAANLLRQIKPELSITDVESLRPGLSKRKTVQYLASRYEALLQANRSAQLQVQDVKNTLEKSENDLQELLSVPDVTILSSTLFTAERGVDLDSEIMSLKEERERAENESRAALNRLGLWNGPLEHAGHLALPLPETVSRFDEEYRLLTDKQRQLLLEKEDLVKQHELIMEQLHHIEFAADVPVEDDLINKRCQRDQGWLLLRRQWLQGEDVAEESRTYDSEHPLPEAYEQMVTLSDQIADRLYREADRVQKHASLKTSAEKIKKRLDAICEAEAITKTALVELTQRWHEQWASFGFTPLSPREMLAWLRSFENLRLQIRELDKLVRDETSKVSRRKELRQSLIKEIALIREEHNFPGVELEEVLSYSRELLNSIGNTQKQRELMTAKIRDARRTLEHANKNLSKADQELRQWQADWEGSVTPLGLNARTLPSEATDFIDTLQECFEKLKEAEDFRKRIEGIDRDTTCFELDVVALINKILPDLATSDARSTVTELKVRLGRASQEKAVLQRDIEELKALENAVITAESELLSCRDEMASMLQLACCDTREEVIEAEQRSLQHSKITKRILEVETHLTRIAEGTTISDLEIQAAAINSDELPGRIVTLNNEIKNILDPEIQQLSESIGRKRNELERMNGSSDAAKMADALQSSLTKIRRLTDRYIRIKLASKILREQTERYRTENQDPVLKIASRYFTELTLGSFIGLRTDVDNHGQLVLEAVRANGNCLQVEAMSSGTRDQLYLALRLATLEWRIKSSEPMPFIVDDILINFDDQRSKATIKALGNLAEKTQVILFTHHQQIVETAREFTASEKVFIHQLGSGVVTT
ncbi:MAG: AAA family ATPase [Chlorobiales bacterium]|nr:AAA family ATPase [Chlorobiales bacterium]